MNRPPPLRDGHGRSHLTNSGAGARRVEVDFAPPDAMAVVAVRDETRGKRQKILKETGHRVPGHNPKSPLSPSPDKRITKNLLARQKEISDSRVCGQEIY